jgi:hypothetical protein
MSVHGISLQLQIFMLINEKHKSVEHLIHRLQPVTDSSGGIRVEGVEDGVIEMRDSSDFTAGRQFP